MDGRVAVPGERVTPHSRIALHGRPVRRRRHKAGAAARRVLLYNKPEGEICTRSDPRGRPTVFRRLPRLKAQRWIAVGRLDVNTSGLLLFTTDGPLANQLLHPALGLEREYLCRVYGEVTEQDMARLERGMVIDGAALRFSSIRRRRGEGRNTWFAVTLSAGRYREVRRLWQAVGCQVSRLNRIRFGSLRIPRGLAPGSWTELSAAQIARLIGGGGD